MKKVGKTIKPFRHHLNQFPNDYTVEVTNRVKGSVSEQLRKEAHNTVQELVIKIQK